jgi:osmotically-inducible protein OsmY
VTINVTGETGESELKWEPSINAAAIGVAVKNGIVTLTGHVSSWGEKYAAEKAAKRVYGVQAVVNDIVVKLPDSSKRTDEDVAAECLNVLKTHSGLPVDRIKLVVEQGRVTLEGEVDWQYQKIAIENAIRHVTGVTAVINNITVKPKVTATDVKQRIEEALKRNAEIDARRIIVEAQDGKVILRGSVRTWIERKEAEQAAWSAPGVTSVENNIVVVP